MKGRVRLSELAGRREVDREGERAGERSAWGKNAGWGRKADTQGFVLKAKREREMERLGERLCLGFLHRGGTGERARAQKPCPTPVQGRF